MTDELAIKILNRMIKTGIVYDDGYGIQPLTEDEEEACRKGIKAVSLIETLTDRPCSVCKHRKENGCSKWECVFKGVLE